ncbi:unnamed protein product [Penicillium bialowiezense]
MSSTGSIQTPWQALPVDPAAAQRALSIPQIMSIILTRDDQEAGKDGSDFMDFGLTNEGFGIDQKLGSGQPFDDETLYRSGIERMINTP